MTGTEFHQSKPENNVAVSSVGPKHQEAAVDVVKNRESDIQVAKLQAENAKAEAEKIRDATAERKPIETSSDKRVANVQDPVVDLPSGVGGKTPTPQGILHIAGSVFLFKDSIRDVGNGYKTAYVVANASDGDKRSKVVRYAFHCKNQQWAYDQIYEHELPFGKGQRTVIKEIFTDQILFDSVGPAQPFIQTVFNYVCN